MIFESLSYIATELNESIRREIPTVTDNKVLLSSIVAQDGSVPVEAEDKILLMLVNVEHETNVPRNTGVGLIDRNLPMNFNLYLLFASSFKNTHYDQALIYLSFVIGYFQSNRAFTKGNSAGLPDGVDQLTLEIVNQGLQEMHNLWGALGAKYMPSILYKVRVLTFDQKAISRMNVAVRGVDTEGSSN